MNNISHQVCPGCPRGVRKVERTDHVNARNGQAVARLVFTSGIALGEIELLANQKASGGSDAEREWLDNVTAEAAEALKENIEALSTELPQRMVTCDQGGPTRFLGRCGAKVIEA